MREAKMTPQEALRALNASAQAGKLDALKFLERNYMLNGKNQKPIRFEPWQVENILVPVFRKINRRRIYDTYLIGLPKKNGKSTLASGLAVYALLLDDPNPEVYSAAGDKDQARIIFNFTKKVFERSPGLQPLVKIYKDEIARIDGNGIYRALASDSSGNHGLNPSCVIWDELWNQPSYDLWEALTHSPARENPFHFIATYSGYQARSGNLLWDLYSRGLAGEDLKQYTFWRSGPDANLASWVTAEYLESQRRRLPDHIFRRLYWNEWSVAQDAKTFRIPEECWQGTFENFLGANHTYAVGIDLAKSRDFTAYSVIHKDVSPVRLVEFGRLPHIDFTKQVEILAAIVKRFGNPRAIVDAGNAGSAVIELMRERGMNVEEFIFTNDRKARIVTDLCLAFEQRKLMLPRVGRTLDENRAVHDLEMELFNFEPTVLRSGNLRYEAGSGYHDDLVTALCLAYSRASHIPHEPMVEVIELGPFMRGGDRREGNFTWHRIG
jgi:terminase large subunit-like protein